MKNCNNCKKTINSIDEFPGQLCQACYELKMDKIPLSQLDKPDFINTIDL